MSNRKQPSASTWSGPIPGEDEDLPVNPFLSLRVAFGMLLGEDDFRTLMGTPRGKLMLHSAWLHGSGVVWGFPLRPVGVREVEVGPGLAVDSHGREVRSERTIKLDVRSWIDAQDSSAFDGAGDRCTVTACVVAEFTSCLTSPVPTLSDPCDVTRQHDDYSRVVETARVTLRLGDAPELAPAPYHRLRALFGLRPLTEGDPDDDAVMQALARLARLPTGERARALLAAFRRFAAYDVVDLEPKEPDGDVGQGLFPGEDGAVVLGAVRITVTRGQHGTDVEVEDVDSTARDVLLPTAVIQDLLCGQAPAWRAPEGEPDAGGPRVRAVAQPDWDDEQRSLTLPLTAPVMPRALRQAVTVTSLSDDGWDDLDVGRVTYLDDPPRLVVHLDDRPQDEHLRLIVRGTGDKPIMGTAPLVPLAGLEGGPPGTVHSGHDAVLTFPNPVPRQNRP